MLQSHRQVNPFRRDAIRFKKCEFDITPKCRHWAAAAAGGHNFSQNFLRAEWDDVELAAVCRLGAAELRQVQQHFGIPFATEDAAELIRQPGLDGVVVG